MRGPYSLWCCRCARAEGRLPREDRTRDLERGNALLAQRMRTLEHDAEEWRQAAASVWEACECAVCVALRGDIARLRERVAALRRFAGAGFTVPVVL